MIYLGDTAISDTDNLNHLHVEKTYFDIDLNEIAKVEAACANSSSTFSPVSKL